MTTPLIRIVCIMLLSVIALAANKPASAAGPYVQVTFSGTGSGASGGTSNFYGCFQYDSSQPKEARYTFSFTNLNHELCYEIGDAAAICYGTVGASATESFIINTAGGVFQLQAVLPTSPQTLIIIGLPMDTTVGPNNLPSTCVFTDPPPTTAYFKVQNNSNGQLIYSGTIGAILCTPSPTIINCPCPPPEINRSPAKAIHHPIVSETGQAPSIPVYAQAPPAPVYACQPRPSCCFSRLFSCCFRPGCR
jgi:hypothetical protein